MTEQQDHTSTGMLSDYLNKAKEPEGQDPPPPKEPPVARGQAVEEPEDKPKGELAEATGQYKILLKDVGKTIAALTGEVEEKPPEPLSQEEIDLLDGFVERGYGQKVYPIGTKRQIEFQTSPTGLAIESDKEIAARLKTEEFTYIGSGRLNNIHLVSIYLARYEAFYTSFPLDAQPSPAEVNDQMLRVQFESVEGWRNRLDFVTSLDAILLEYIANKLYAFHQHCDRLLSHEGLTDF